MNVTETTGRISNATIDFETGKPKLLLELDSKSDLTQCYDDLKDVDKLAITIKPYKQKRSIDANAYAWKLIGDIAEKLSLTKAEIYKEMIKNIGGNSDIVCVKNAAVKSLCNGWGKNGIGWQSETMPSKIVGCTNIVLYYGSSVYDTRQMSRLIDLIVSECEKLGIQTKTPAQIAELKSLWGEK